MALSPFKESKGEPLLACEAMFCWLPRHWLPGISLIKDSGTCTKSI